MLQIAICDDNKVFARRQRTLVIQHMKKNRITVHVDVFLKGKELIEAARQRPYDLIFLDIEMQEENGITIAKQIRALGENGESRIAFVTAYINFSLEGYKVQAFRYILKDEKSMGRAVAECLDAFLNEYEKSKAIYELMIRGMQRKINLRNLIYVESSLHNVIYHVLNNDRTECISIKRKLDDVENELQMFPFIRIHKSYLVNLGKIATIYRYQLVLKDGTVLPVAQQRFKLVNEQVVDYLGEL